MKSEGDLFTPKFRVKEEYKKEYKKVSPDINYELRFGDDIYSVNVNNPDKIINYFIDKACVTLKDYSDCKEYDSKHKFKHFEKLKDCFTYKKIK